MDSRAGAKGRAYRTAQGMGLSGGKDSSYLQSASQSYSRGRRSRGSEYSRGRVRTTSYGRGGNMFGSRRGVAGVVSGVLANWRSWAPIAGVVIAIILLFLVISSALRSCTPAPEPTQAPEQTLMQACSLDSMMGFESPGKTKKVGTLTMRANTKLNHDAIIAQIGSEMTSATTRGNLDEYAASKGMALTSRTEQAANFVLGLTEQHDGAQAFTGAVPSGTVPALYQWDERWGYTDYCGHALGFTGCGVTVMAMARMGLTGATDMTPADMAALSVSLGEAADGTNSTFFYNEQTAAATGVSGVYASEPEAYTITANLQAGSYVAINVRPNTLAGGGHWILAVGVNDDGSIEIRDPNSPENTAKAWDINELVSYANAMVILSKA